MFRCESEGYEAVIFGAFDGITSWVDNAYINLGPTHQEVVSAHEERHLRLQKATLWGALMMLLALQDDETRLTALVMRAGERMSPDAIGARDEVGYVAEDARGAFTLAPPR